ncbi:lactate racemase domain-containing protein [Natronomonas sp. LN261]|uniref:lactate racemase domain-containing protein n=1 Tax=Natronomonas sp. LN261 TaxID=2750669 RepID=UPI0015EEFF14|nr:lactate racemase domain-containing protein [Natronomonas sp. LN261]
MTPVRVPLGGRSIDVALPDCAVTVADPPGGTAVDVRAAAEAAVAEPIGPGLADSVAPDDSVVIVVTDLTRATPDAELVDVLCAELARAGVRKGQVTVVVGLGLHRPMTDAELAAMLGEHADIAVNHDPDDTVVVGRVDGVPIECNRRVADADLVLATGMVEPHQYAGFSGGGKTVAIGAGGESLISYTHGPELLSRPGVRLGRIEDNPFRAAVDEAGDLCGLGFCLNVTHGPAGILDVAAGTPRPVVETLADSAREALSVEVDGEYDAVIAGVGAPKDATLYQATRAATYVALGANDPLRSGGRLVVPAALTEGAGEGTGERRFYDRLSGASDADALYAEMREGYEPGAQRAFVLARVLTEYDVYVTNSDAPDVVDACLMESRERVADAIEPGSDVLVVPDALHTLLV